MVGLTNLTSVILALVAMILPVINIMLSRKNKKQDWGSLAFASLISCAISIWLPYVDIYSRVIHDDWAGIIDTVPSIFRVWGIVLVVTVVLNVATYFMNRKNVT